MSLDKLYVLVRSDLPSLGDMVAQAVHAAIDLCLTADEATLEALRAWHRTSNTLVVTEAPGEAAVRRTARQAAERGLAAALFTEPDLGGQATAVALVPGALAKRLCRGYRLALRGDAARGANPVPVSPSGV